VHKESASWTETLLHSRRTTLPKRLCGPGPDAAQQAQILRAAAAAPDHGQLLPWRFIEVPEAQRPALAAAFVQALHERDPLATAEQRQQAGDKAHRSPWLLLAVCAVRGGDPEVPAQERLLSAGCALQNMLLMATAMGFGSALTSGKALQSAALRTLFGLGEHEDALCFLNVGQVVEPRRPRPRPAPEAYFSRLG
jgi:nitroreductase